MQWLFWVIYWNYRGLGTVFAAYFLHDFSIKMFFNWYSPSIDKVSLSYLFSFPRCQTKCVIEFLFRQLVTSWTLRFIFDYPLKQWLTGRKRWKNRKTKNWISPEQKELFSWNKKQFVVFIVFEGLSFSDKIRIWWK